MEVNHCNHVSFQLSSHLLPWSGFMCGEMCRKSNAKDNGLEIVVPLGNICFYDVLLQKTPKYK